MPHICKNCGAYCEDNVTFCTNCGASQYPQNAPQQQTPPPQNGYGAPYQQNGYNTPYQQNGYNAPYPQNSNYYGAPAPSNAKGMAIAGLVLGILAFFIFPIVTGTLGIVFGGVAKSKGYRGGMATAGIVCGCIGIALWIIMLLVVDAAFFSMFGI